MKFQKVSKEQWDLDTEKILGHNPLVKNASYDNIKIPRRETKKSAGYDFIIPFDLTISPRESILIPVGVRCVYMPENSVLLIAVRSSIGIKKYCRLLNQIGIVDADYANAKNEGHIFIALQNTSYDKFVTFNVGDRIAQGIIVNYLTVVDDAPANKERIGGVGSTGN